LGHVLRMDSSGSTVGTERLKEKTRTTKEELVWTSSNETSRVDLTWEEAEAKILANDKAEWHRRVWPNAAIWMRDELRSNSPRNR